MTWVASALLLAATLDGPSPQQIERLAREKSPTAFVQALEWARVRCDPAALKAAYDPTTEMGRAQAEAVEPICRGLRARQAAAAAARRKYGAEGVLVLEQAFRDQFDAPADLKTRARIAGAKAFIAEDGRTAVVRMPGSDQKWSYTEVERKRGRWFIASDGASDADVVTIQLAGAIAEVYLAEPYEKAAEIIESSKTLDEARAALAARKKPFDALMTGQNQNEKQ